MDTCDFGALKANSSNYYFVTFGFLAVNLFLILTWYYWKCIKPFTEFPSYNMFNYFIYKYFIKKVPRTAPFRNIMLQKALSAAKRYESEGLVLFWGFPTILMVFGTEATKTLLVDNKISLKESYYRFLRQYFGMGLLTSNGDTWKKHRKLFAPVFHTDMLKTNINLFNEHAKRFVTNLAEAKENPIIILDFIKPCSFGIICESILGLKVHSNEHEGLTTEYLLQITTIFKYVVQRMMHPWLHLNFLLPFTPFGRKCLKLREDHYNLLHKMIVHTKRYVSEKQEGDDSDKLSHKFFAQILLEQHLKDPSFTIKYIQDQMTTFVAAGYDTVSHTMMWCLFFLGHHQEIQERVYREVELETEDFVTFDGIRNLKYLENVIKETLRLRPTIPFYSRQCEKSIKLGKYTVPKNTNIMFSAIALHRNPEIFPDPEKFDPDRFSEGKSPIRSWEFTPFAAGTRDCIGKRFAMWEMKVVLAHVLRKFKIVSLDKIEDIAVSLDAVLAPSRPLRVQLTEREQ